MIRLLFISLFLLGGFVFYTVARVDKEDRKEYEKLLSQANQKKEEQALSYFSQQWRKNIVKEVWKGPLYLRMDCPFSELVAVKGEGKYDAIEKMGKVSCVLQEKLFYEAGDPSIKQEVRYFEADKGFCSYGNLDFVGLDVKMKKYKFEGTTPPLTPPRSAPLSQGSGEKLHFCLKDQKIDLELNSFETSFNPKEGI